MRTLALAGFLLLCGVVPVMAQSPTRADTIYADTTRSDATPRLQVADTSLFSRPLPLGEVVVTATRSAKRLEQVAVPTSVVSAAEMEAQGAVRLSDVLAQQPGLQLNYDHGAGVQVQGFDADYTLILIDGQPIIGRTAGTLNLDRITVSGVERVEVVRGPSSSLYGSEALAGVVNVITQDVRAPLRTDVQARYGTHGTTNFSARVAGTQEPVRVSAFVSRYGSGGYDLSPTTATPTVPSFSDYIGRSTVAYELGASTELEVRARASHEAQRSTVEVTGEDQLFNNEATRTDWSLAPRITHRLRPGVQVEARLFGSGYRTQTDLTGASDGALFSRDDYDQRQHRAEAQVQAALTDAHLLTAGAGYITESVEADRVQGDRTGGFVFIQDEWAATSWLDLIPSARLDAHSDYATRISPKLAALGRPVDGMRLRASVGSGYKAPAFRQLYLDFTNPRAGYSVFGAEDVQGNLAALDEQGQVDAYLIAPSTLGEPIEAERSVAVNVGVGFDLIPDVSMRVNGFHNEVRDLIDTQPVARKTNGQQVFSYFNRGRVFTRGVEAELTWQAIDPLQLALSYTYLQAKDRDVLDDLNAGRIYRRTDAGRDVQVTSGAYGGLPGRSRHRATARLNYRYAPLGITVDARARYRGRYGFIDQNGNGIIDIDSEYAPGYAVVDLTLTKTLFDNHALQVGADNLTNHVAPQYVPFLSGRTWFVGLRAQF
jgi:outer membrane receptor for ferrienterochelin and colicins